MKEKNETIFEHLKDLRRAIIISLLAFLIGVLGCYFFLIEPLMALVFDPIRMLGKDVVLTGVAEGFMIQLKLACSGGIIIASPIILWQILWFVLPALYKHEKKAFLLYFAISLILFIIGIILGYLFVLKVGLHTFLIDYNKGFTTMISASKYISFFTYFLLPFGLILQIPLLTYFLSCIGLVTPRFMKKNRSYAVMIILICAAILTPPDVLSQILLTLPMIFLYEISILLASFVDRRRKLQRTS
jgi:Twin arginine targeting (Tat) protein translocase TatC